MERRDAVIGAIGAAVVLLATIGVGIAGGPGREAYEVAFPLQNVHAGDGSLAHFNEPSFNDAFAFELTPKATALFVNASVDFIGAPQASALATLTAPDGTRHEAEGALTVAPQQSRFTFAFSLPLREPPAGGPCEDLAACVPPGNATSETWVLEVAFSSGLVPSPSATTAWSADALAWRAEVTPRPPAAR